MAYGLRNELGGGVSHCKRHAFERFTNTPVAPIDRGSNTNFWQRSAEAVAKCVGGAGHGQRAYTATGRRHQAATRVPRSSSENARGAASILITVSGRPGPNGRSKVEMRGREDSTALVESSRVSIVSKASDRRERFRSFEAAHQA